MTLAARKAARTVASDEDLVALVRTGDEAAFSVLYRRHVGIVYGRVTRLLGPVNEREDVTQDVFLRLHRSLPTFRGDCRFSSFLYRVVASTVHDHLRQRRRRPLQLRDDLDSWLAQPLSDERRIVARQDLKSVLEAMDRLSARKRIAFWLTRIEGLSCSEAGAIVGARAATVKQRALAAKRELERHIARQPRT